MKRLAALALLVACGSAPPRRGVGPDAAVVYLRSNLEDAQVYLDGRFIGAIGNVARGIALDAGHHRVELRHDDYFARYADLDLHRAEHKKLALPMAPMLP